jgi:hypothetical protein
VANAPYLINQFVSSSGQTVIQYYGYDAGVGPPGTNYFRGAIGAPSGFDQAEVFLSGFMLRSEVESGRVQRVSVLVQKHRYTTATGELELSVRASLWTGTNQNQSYRVTFVVILTGATLAKFTPVSTGCRGTASCNITRSIPVAIPTGMQFIGLATRNWDIGSESGPLRLNALSGHINNHYAGPDPLKGPSVYIDYMFFLQDASAQNPMFAEWGAAVIAFDPSEMGRHGGPLPYQYTSGGTKTSKRIVWTNQHSNPSGSPIAGFLDAFEGLSLFDPSAIGPPLYPPPLVDKRIWLLESTAEGFAIPPFMPQVALTNYGIFLGTEFGNTSTATPFGYQASRALGFLL